MASTAPLFKIPSVQMCTGRRDEADEEMASATWWSQDNFEWSNWIALSASRERVCVCVWWRSFTLLHNSIHFVLFFSAFFIFYLHEAHYLILFRFIFHIYRNAAHFFFASSFEFFKVNGREREREAARTTKCILNNLHFSKRFSFYFFFSPKKTQSEQIKCISCELLLLPGRECRRRNFSGTKTIAHEHWRNTHANQAQKYRNRAGKKKRSIFIMKC